jgi:two-component system sensor histidine kinase PilS (NtrC family)
MNVQSELYRRLKWLTFFRLLCSTALLAGAAYLHAEGVSSFFTPPLLAIYSLCIGVFTLSIIYALLLNRLRQYQTFAAVQVSIDTVIVTLMIYLTGGFSSSFSLLYLVIMIYSSMLIYRKGSLIMAALCSIQYGIMVDLEYYGIINPLVSPASPVSLVEQWRYVLFKILMIAIGCFAVSFLSSLLTEQLRRSRRELQAMEEHLRRVEKLATVGEMAAGLAHEIKNPLASLSGSIQLIREDIPFNEDHDRLMKIVLREADRLNSLLSNFLLFARPQARKLERIDVERALGDSVSLFEKHIGSSRRIQIHRAFTPGIWIEMDPMHLHQVMWNLLLNASEAIDDNGRISISSHGNGDRSVRIEVADTGCGIPENRARHIFDPFYTTKSNGTGLGLSIVHRILETYDARVSVESHPGSGTSFILDIKRFAVPG